MKNILTINKYKIYLDIDFDNLLYNGHETINLIINCITNKIILNCKEIIITSILLNNKNCTYKIIEDEEIIIIKHNFIPGIYELKIIFNNKINNELDGLYYVKENDKIIICSNLEPCSARRFFPCFDDPNFKANFNLLLKIPIKYFGISNMNIKNIKKNNLFKFIQFYSTPKMSTYLFCIVVGDIVKVLDKPLISTNGTLINGYCLENRKEYMKWSIKKTVNSLEYYEKLFGIKYCLPKLDIVSIPNFLSGAMENWGIITFREEYILLLNPYDSINKLRILEVIYHELVHQWFGNLVTLDSWDNLWLNESNATFLSWQGLNIVYPKLYSKEMYFLLECKNLLILDAMENTQAILPKNYKNPLDLFNEISYSKGSWLLYYICCLIGEENYIKSNKKFLEDNMFSNCNSYELYKNFNLFNDKIDFIKLINDLINFAGYPILYFKKNNDNKIIITKKKFNLDKNKISVYPIEVFFKIYYKNEDIIINLKNEQTEFIFYDNKFFPNPNNEFQCIISYENIDLEIQHMNEIQLLKYCVDQFILSKYGHKKLNDYYYLIEQFFISIDLRKYPIFLEELLNQINKLFLIYSLCKKDNSLLKNLIEKFKKNIISFLEYFLEKKSTYFEMLINEILILLTINLLDENFIILSKKILEEQICYKKNFYFKNSLFKIMQKFYPKYNFYNKIKNNYKINFNIIFNKNIIESYQYLSEEDLDNIIKNIENIKTQDLPIFFSAISKNIILQKKIINYFYINKNKITKSLEIQNKIIKLISYNIFELKNYEIFIKSIDMDAKINDILNTNKIIFDNL